MAKKFYAVRRGRVPGIYTSWDECRRQVTGYSGAEYKGFETRADAEAFMSGGGVQCGARQGAATAYVDGSFDVKTKRYSYGMVIMHNGKEVTKNEAFDDEALAGMRNVAGEIEGAKAAMLWCITNDVKELDLFYDYAGIEKWCTGEWKTNKPGTVAYKEFYDWAKECVNVSFIKVKGHSGDKYNDMADKLAKEALGI